MAREQVTLHLLVMAVRDMCMFPPLSAVPITPWTGKVVPTTHHNSLQRLNAHLKPFGFDLLHSNFVRFAV